jgi:hypothetical protein
MINREGVLLSLCSGVVRVLFGYACIFPNMIRTSTEHDPNKARLSALDPGALGVHYCKKPFDRNVVVVAELENGDRQVSRLVEMVPDLEQQCPGVFGAFS